MDCRDTQSLLDAYVDHELDTGAGESVERHLEECEDCSAARQRITDLSVAARQLRHTLPPGLESMVRSAVRKDIDAQRTRSLRLWRITALAACVIAAVSVVWSITSRGENRLVASSAVADQAIAGHVRSLMAEHLVDVLSSDQHTVKPWFAGKINFSPDVRDFADHEYLLVGGRLDYLAGRPVVALVYKHRRHTINAFTWPAGGDITAQSNESRQGFHILRWRDRQMNWCLVSDASEETLLELRRLINQHAPPAGATTRSTK